MHEPVEILSLSRRSSLPTFFTLFRTQLLFFFSPRLFPLFISLSAAACLPLLSLATLYSRGARLLATFEFNFLTQRGDAEKHLRAIKDRRWEVQQTMVKKGEKEREIEKVRQKRKEGRMRLNRKTDELEMANVTVERSLRDVKCRDATIDIECRRRDVGTCRDANVSKFCNRTPATGNDI